MNLYSYFHKIYIKITIWSSSSSKQNHWKVKKKKIVKHPIKILKIISSLN